MQTRPVTALPLLALLLAGCSVPTESGLDGSLSGGAQAFQVVPHTVAAAEEGAAPVDDSGSSRALSHPAALHLVLDDSPIVPWCSGVLVAPDVAVTTSACVAAGTSRLSVAFGTPNEGDAISIADVVRLERDPRLSALVLDSSITDVEPVSIAEPSGRTCGVKSISYLHVIGDDPSRRWIWSGCLDVAKRLLEPVDGAPNCHGDNGAPAFSSEGALIGLTVGARGGTPCVEAIELAVPGKDGPFEEAVALSR